MRSGAKAVIWGIALAVLLILGLVVETVYGKHWQAVREPVDTCEYIASVGDMRIYADHMGGAFWRRVSYD